MSDRIILRLYEDMVESMRHSNVAQGPMPTHYAMGLCAEAGEVADVIDKRYFFGKPLILERLEDELGDVLWYLTALALHHGLSLESIMARNTVKLRTRYPDGFDPSRR